MQTQVLQETINKYLKGEKESAQKLFSKLSLYIYQQESGDSDLHILAEILPLEYLIPLISYYDGDVIKLPSLEKLQNSIFLAICFYLKEIKGQSWEEIKGFLSLPEQSTDMLNPIPLGRKINSIKVDMNKYLSNLLKTSQYTEEDIQEFLDEVEKNVN